MLYRLTTESDEAFDAEKMIFMIIVTPECEGKASSGASCSDCFRGANSRRIGIVCLLWAA